MARRQAIVYIDGENFLHRIEDSLKAQKVIQKKEQILHFAVQELLSPLTAEFNIAEVRYYGTKIRVANITDPQMRAHAQAMVESQRRFKRDLLNQKINFIVAGALRVRDTTCYKCKKTSPVFKEKGVDVRMAVDIVTEANEHTDQIIISSDSDLLPALKRATQQKSRIIYVHHAQLPNYAMIKASDESRVFTTRQIQAAYASANKAERKH